MPMSRSHARVAGRAALRAVAVAAALGAVWLPAGRGLAQAPSQAAPIRQAPQPAHQVDLAALDRYIEQARVDWNVPGLAIAAVKDGRIVMAKGYGVRELGRAERVDERTLFAIASNTKAFTAATLAMLVEEGRLSWDDPVRQHLPWFELADPLASREMRVRDLLAHRSGLGTFSGDLVWYGTGYTAAEVVRRARFLEPASSFRARYGYSNIMFIAAGEVVQAVAGQPWTAFVRERILEPLGMQDTVLSVRELGGRANVATPHGPASGEIRPFPWYGWDSAAAAGGLISSVSDMSRWMLLQLARGSLDGRTYFSDAASRTMWTPHVSSTVDKAAAERIPSTHFRGYGLGWSLRDYGGRLVADHGGGYDGMFSKLALVPDDGVGVVVLTNSMTGIADAIVSRSIDAFLGLPERDWSREGLERARWSAQRRADELAVREKARVDGTRPSWPLPAYAGRYSGDLYGAVSVAFEGEGLVLRMEPTPDLVADLTHWHHDTFQIHWRTASSWFGTGWAQFVSDAHARIVELKLDVPNEDFWFHELKLRRQ
jgi:CubicO group peptidase (beta-lactamase class C family)